MVTGIDIVREGIRVAAGEPLSITQDDVVLKGHAIECRINAENAARNFAPAPGRITTYTEPSGPGIRVDSGVTAGGEITPHYDPMIAKLIVWDVDREHATRRMLRALAEYQIGGLTTLIPFHRALLATEQWARAQTCRDLLEDRDWLKSTAPQAAAPSAAEEPAEKLQQDYTVEVSGRRFQVKVIGPPLAGGHSNGTVSKKTPRRERASSSGGGGGDTLVSPMQGTVLRVAVEQGATVQEGALIAVVEAMKMENEITAHKAGTIVELPIVAGGAVASGDTLAVIT
jgi:acetyl-CoA/propionyl-CoA carboxylase biotin carboxyl carrier protein